MFDIGLQELVLIFVIALLVFGPKNLPQLGRSLGRAMREFRKASDEFRTTLETNLEMHEVDPPAPSSPEPQTTAATPSTVAGESAALPDSVLNPYGAESTAVVVAEAAADVGEPYVAQRGAKLFHGRACGWTKRIPEAERTYFKRVADAKDAGLAACPVCEPWEPA
jgi:sec-independent protein translocase protein TatA